MKHIKIISNNIFEKDHQTNCKECQSSCQSACKTSCTVGNQSCAREEKINKKEADIIK
ncbi:MAG: six-cysteine peptide SCIFF [Clostridiales bacterium]|jgi:predicted ribosomally synthesized six-cysteine peptide SCIFF|nr:six-cysteine peptide SCIFF [Clostridiales bacterium]